MIGTNASSSDRLGVVTIKCRNDSAFRSLMRAALDAYARDKWPAKASVVLDFNSDGDL